MAEIRRIKMSLFLILVLQFTAVTADSLNIVVRSGDEVTLHCENVMDDQDKCDRTSWLFVRSGRTRLEQPVVGGQIGENVGAKDRLSVTETCALVMKKVTDEDVGLYTCRQFKKSGQDQDNHINLFVVAMTEQKHDDKMTLYCSVGIQPQYCGHTVQWLHEDKDVETSQSGCLVTVTFPTSDLKQRSKFKCEVTDRDTRKVTLFDFSPQSSGETPEDATTATTSTRGARTESSSRTTTTSTAPASNGTATTPEDQNNFPDWWVYIPLALGLVVLIIILVTIIAWKRAKGKKTQKDESTGQRLSPAVTESGPGTAQDTADPEDGVSYASISYAKKINSKARVQIDDEDDTVTYSTVKASASPAGATDDPNTLYATINK